MCSMYQSQHYHTLLPDSRAHMPVPLYDRVADLTVREHVSHAARIRLPSDTTRSRRKGIIHDVLQLMV